jgi:hypothetical protein
MTARPRRTPSPTGFKDVPSPADIPIKKKLISKVKEKALDLLVPTDTPSPVPKNFVFLGDQKIEDYGITLTKMLNSPYPTCCGAQIIHGFTSLVLTQSHTQRVALIAAQVRVAEAAKIGMLLAMVNHSQKLTLHKAFEECGFKLVSCTSNPNHDDNTTIYLYVKLIGKKDLALDGKQKQKSVAA